jgi:hypothetical protein
MLDIHPYDFENNAIGRKLGDHTYLTWSNDTPSTATATGRDNGPSARP